MRAYHIALFFLSIQLTSGLLQLTPLFDNISTPVDTPAFEHINKTIDESVYYNQTEIDYNSEFERSGISDALTTLGKSLSIKNVMVSFGVTDNIATYFSYAVYFIYILGAIQLLLLRKGMGDVS